MTGPDDRPVFASEDFERDKYHHPGDPIPPGTIVICANENGTLTVEDPDGTRRVESVEQALGRHSETPRPMATMTGPELRAVREQYGESQVAFALRIGVARPALNRWENDRRTIPPYIAAAVANLRREQ